jgi:uncharacterized protein
MKTNHLSVTKWPGEILQALLFVFISGAIIIVLKPWGKLFLVNQFSAINGSIYDYLARAIIGLILLVVAGLLRRNQRLEKYRSIANALFILDVALSLALIANTYVLAHFGLSENNLAYWAFPKLNEAVLVVLVVILFTRLSDESLSSIYLHKGNLKLGLIFGITSFLLAAGASIPMANLLFKAEGLTIARVIPWIPWLLLTVLSNGTLEEVLFRGLFLRKLQPFFGKFVSNFLIAFVFTILHQGSTYTSDQYFFLAATFPLALVWGYFMQKTDGVWASILFHAGMDIPIFLGIFSTL